MFRLDSHPVTGMFAAILALIATTAPAHAVSDQVAFSALDHENYDLSRESVVQLLCRDPATEHTFLSRGVVLDYRPEGASFDLVLATRHGVYAPAGPRDCRVRGVPETMGRVTEIRAGIPDVRDSSDFSEDWAILRTRQRLPASVPRLRVLAFEGASSGELTLLVRPVDRAPCAVPDPPEALGDPDLILHDCIAHRGLSGSPLVTQIAGVPYVVGVHVGRYLIPDGEWREYGVARRVSGDFLAALDEVLSAPASGPQ